MRTTPDPQEIALCRELELLTGAECIWFDMVFGSRRPIYRAFAGDDFETADHTGTSPFSFFDALNVLAEDMGLAPDGEWQASQQPGAEKPVSNRVLSLVVAACALDGNDYLMALDAAAQAVVEGRQVEFS